MRKVKSQWLSAILFMAFIFLILDTKCAAVGVSEGITLCIQTAIPAIFPFLLIAPLLTASVPNLRILHVIGKPLGIPAGSEPIFIAGLLCGYPVGAKAVCDAWKEKTLTKAEAIRMLSFSNNAGPAFLFGIGYSAFSEKWIPWMLWIIHILSAFLVGCLLPGKTNRHYHDNTTNPLSFQKNLEKSLVVMAHICGWIIVMRVILSFLSKWILWLFPNWIQVLICGFFELANGCSILHQISDPSIRFLIMTGILSFGGISVHLQTYSVAGALNATRHHLIGKLLHSSISVTLASMIFVVIPIGQHPVYPMLFCAITVSIVLICAISRKNSSIPETCSV